MKKDTQILALIIAGVILGGLLIYFGSIQNTYYSEAQNCNFGGWGFSSVDPQTGILIINYNQALPNDGCQGINTVSRKGISIITDEQTCTSFGFTWRTETPYEAYHCFLSNENWAKDKTIESVGTCTHTRQEPLTVNYAPSFDGVKLSFSDSKRSNDDVVQCSGTVTIAPPLPILSTIPLPSTAPAPSGTSSSQPSTNITGTSSAFTGIIIIIGTAAIIFLVGYFILKRT
jgi:hypothetical protein